jgi:hypothetical protein
VGNHTISDFLGQIMRNKSARLLCFSHKSKLHIADQALTTQGITTAYMNDATVFLPERIDLLLHKGSFDEGELSFLAKYLSHHLQGHTMMDINSSDDYKIFHALTEQKTPRAGQVTLATHEQLYASTHPLDPATNILFFDVDRRRQTRGNHSNEPLDPHHLLQYLEHNAYKATLLQDHLLAKEIQKLTTEVHLFFGVLGGEIDHLFVGHPSSTVEIDSLVDHTRLPKSKASLDKLLKGVFFASRNDEIVTRWTKQRERISNLFHHTVIVTKAMYQGDKWRYTFAPPKGFSTFGEMREQLPKARYSFLSSLNAQATPLGKQQVTTPLLINEHIHRPSDLIAFLDKHEGNIFLLT